MSLLNDALKRAKEAQRPDIRSSVSSMRTLETRPAEHRGISRLLVAVIFLLLATAFAFIGLAMTGRLAKNKMAAPVAPALTGPVSTAPPAVSSAPQPASPPPGVAAARVQPAKKPSPVAVLPPLVLPDMLHVQGVAADPAGPWAIVSGKMVHIGDMIKGVRVMDISRDSVTFGSNGQTNLLFVGQ
jgi:hypothetical protein